MFINDKNKNSDDESEDEDDNVEKRKVDLIKENLCSIYDEKLLSLLHASFLFSDSDVELY